MTLAVSPALAWDPSQVLPPPAPYEVASHSLQYQPVSYTTTHYPLPHSDYPALFGTGESRSGNLEPFPKWTGAMERYRQEAQGARSERIENWHLFLQSIRSLPVREQITQVNDYMNKTEYLVDSVNWGKVDYWATPKQFLGQKGDCEDYAIAKYLSLRALGMPAESLRVVVLQDTNLDILHAVLAVYVGKEIYILDNQINQVLEASAIHHYEPIYSINETHWWRHRG